jgi:hypothetical protein
MSYPIKRETFKSGDLALYRHGLSVASVVIVRCSFFCPAFDDHPEQSKYTVRLDGDIQPLNPTFTDTFPRIHGVDLKELESRTASGNYELNTGLWDLKVVALAAKYKADEAEKKYAAAVVNVAAYGKIVPGTRVVWYSTHGVKALSAVVERIDLIRGYCIVDGDYEVRLHDISTWD